MQNEGLRFTCPAKRQSYNFKIKTVQFLRQVATKKGSNLCTWKILFRTMH